jgi:hypothetical protein
MIRNVSVLSIAAVALLATSAVASVGTIDFKGQRVTIGSAAAKARAIQQRTRNAPLLLPNGPLYVADPALNGVMVYDQQASGNNILPYGILSGPNTQLNGPVALGIGDDLPCSGGGCQRYLWVSNAGNATLTYYTLPLTAWNQAPVAVISGPAVSGCGPGFSNPYGIVHTGPYGTSTPGQILQTSESNFSGNYYIVGYQANLSPSGPYACNAAITDPGYASPSGPSVRVGSSSYLVFNANGTTVTKTPFIPLNAWGTVVSWTVGPGASTQGTAVQQPTDVWVTTAANVAFPKDALWRCKIAAFPACPASPVCVNPAAKLDFPVFPATSVKISRIYVPNQNNGTVTAYDITATTCKLVARYVNVQRPFGVAVTFQ